MTPADLDSIEGCRNQTGSNAVFIFIADQVIRIVQFEGEAEYGRDRGQRNISLVPIKPDTNNFLSAECTFADYSRVRYCRRV